jgi:hypothetical protein
MISSGRDAREDQFTMYGGTYFLPVPQDYEACTAHSLEQDIVPLCLCERHGVW